MRINPEVINNIDIIDKLNDFTTKLSQFYNLPCCIYTFSGENNTGLSLLYFDVDNFMNFPEHYKNGLIRDFNSALNYEINWFKQFAELCINAHIIQRVFIKIHLALKYDPNHRILTDLMDADIINFKILSTDIFKKLNADWKLLKKLDAERILK